MSDLAQKIEADLKQAMLARAADKVSVLRMFKSAVKYAAIEKGGASASPTDEDVIAVARKEIKKRQDSIQSFTQAGRTDLADKESAELLHLQGYLPAALDEAEIARLVDEAISETGATGKAQMGAVMKSLQSKVAGRADNKTLSQLVQSKLK